ncbi:hypothetical protein, partial [Mesorhizobium sp.]|uniref:hypothetical protein n=1 Tax=Mesorhizobium sp. TaxID=1871066 RepID=UPI002580D348
AADRQLLASKRQERTFRTLPFVSSIGRARIGKSGHSTVHMRPNSSPRADCGEMKWFGRRVEASTGRRRGVRLRRFLSIMIEHCGPTDCGAKFAQASGQQDFSYAAPAVGNLLS